MLYIGIPAYNEATTIGVLLWRLRSVLAEVSREYEVVVYDDASTDQTAETLAPYSRVLPLTVIRGTQRLGYAGATDALVRHVARTTRYPRRDALLLLQGDFTDPPALVPEFLRRFEGGADLVIGERVSSGDAPQSVKRLWQASRWVLRPFVGISDVRDLTTSFRLVRIAVLRDLIKAAGDSPIVSGDAWSANADFLLRTAPHARRVETIPVTPTFNVRTRESRRTAWPDAIALAKWGWSKRGQRVAAKVIARAVEGTDTDETATADVPDRGGPERRDRHDKRGRREDADAERGSRDKSAVAEAPARERAARERPPRERPPRDRLPRERAPRDESVRSESALTSAVASDAATDSKSTESEGASRPARKRRKRGARRDRTAPLQAGGDDSEPRDELGPERDDLSTNDAGERENNAASGDETGSDGAELSGEAPARRKRSRRGRRRRGESRSANGAEPRETDSESDVNTDARDPRSEPARRARSEGEVGDDRAERGDENGDHNGDESGRAASGAGDGDEAARKRRRSRRGRRGGSRKRTNDSPGEGESREYGSDADQRNEGAGGGSEGA